VAGVCGAQRISGTRKSVNQALVLLVLLVLLVEIILVMVLGVVVLLLLVVLVVPLVVVVLLLVVVLVVLLVARARLLLVVLLVLALLLAALLGPRGDIITRNITSRAGRATAWANGRRRLPGGPRAAARHCLADCCAWRPFGTASHTSARPENRLSVLCSSRSILRPCSVAPASASGCSEHRCRR